MDTVTSFIPTTPTRFFVAHGWVLVCLIVFEIVLFVHMYGHVYVLARFHMYHFEILIFVHLHHLLASPGIAIVGYS